MKETVQDQCSRMIQGKDHAGRRKSRIQYKRYKVQIIKEEEEDLLNRYFQIRCEEINFEKDSVT